MVDVDCSIPEIVIPTWTLSSYYLSNADGDIQEGHGGQSNNEGCSLHIQTLSSLLKGYINLYM